MWLHGGRVLRSEYLERPRGTKIQYGCSGLDVERNEIGGVISKH